MKIQSIDNTNFTAKILVDIGGSVKENSCKINILSNDGKDSFIKEKTIVNTPGERTYKSNDDFLEKLEGRIAPLVKQLQKMNLPKEEKTINELIFFVPGYAHNNKLIYADNIRQANGKGSESVDFNEIKTKNSAFKNSNVRVVQDAMGCGIKVADELHKAGLLDKGSHYAVAITGGGCGISNIRAIDDDKAIVDASGSSYFTNTQGIVKIANMGASAPALIKNFCNAFGIDKALGEEIAKFGVGQMVTRHSFRMPEGKEGLKEMLKATGKYHFEGDMVFVKESYTKQFNHARMYAVEHYADALARFGIIKENEGANGMIVTGPLAMAINGVYQQLGYTSLAEVIEEKIIEDYNTRELDEIKRFYGFKVICDDRLKLEDNTECKDLIVNSEFAGNNRYNWIEVDFNK